MKYINIPTEVICGPTFRSEEPLQRATWFALLAYCCDVENWGVIQNCRDWSDRRWLQVCGVTQEEVGADSGLWQWENNDLHIEFYPTYQHEVLVKRRLVGATGGRPSKKNQTENQERNNKVSEKVNEEVSKMDSDEETESGNVISNKEIGNSNKKKRKTGASAAVVFPASLDTEAFRTAWAQWVSHRKEKKNPLTPTSISRQMKKLEEAGPAKGVRMLERSIEHGWSGVFDLPAGEEPTTENSGTGRRPISRF